MFSFFKFIQKTLKELKSNKGLWFTILAVLSITGIFLSLYILTHMTENSSKEVYESISSNYSKNYKNRVLKKEETLNQIVLTVESNEELISNIEANNLIAVGSAIKIYNDNFKKSGYETLNLSFYPVFNQVNQYRNSVNSVINSKSNAFGIEVLQDGIFVVLIKAVLVDDKLIGILELKQELHDFKAEYLKDDLIFMFLLEERMLNQLSIKARNGKYKQIADGIHVEEAKYDGQFFGKIIEGGKEKYKEMMDVGYFIDDTYFRAAQKVSDINGNIIGIIVLGESAEGTGSFVNIVDKMTKTVTTVALGLVISILLFMF